MSKEIYGGINIAMKVPTHQYQQTVAFYRDTLGLEMFTEKPPNIGFIYGPNRLWIDEVGALSQAEVWLELFTPDFERPQSNWRQRASRATTPSSRWVKGSAAAGSSIRPASSIWCASLMRGEAVAVARVTPH